MLAPSIRTRVTAFMVLLMTMGLVEAGVVLYVQRETERALDEAGRTEAILRQHADAVIAIGAMRAAHRGLIITGDPGEGAAFEQQWRAYERAVSAIVPLLEDQDQRLRFERVQVLSRDWRDAATLLIDEVPPGPEVAARLMRDVIPRFEALSREFDAFERLQSELSSRASEVTRSRVRNATFALTAIPAFAIVMIVSLLVATERAILRPLRAVVESARRLVRGDYAAPLPRPRPDEIGVLITAFDEMRTAVHERASEAAAAHRQVVAAHAELQAVIDTVPAALVIVESDGAMRLQNRAAEQLLGRTPQTVEAGKAFWQGFTIRDAAGQPVRLRDLPPVRALSGVETGGEELDIVTPDGRRLDIIIAAAPLRDEDGRITAAVAGFQDISRLRELDRLKDEFVAVVSHELRTPLTSIRGALQLLLAGGSISDPDDRQLLSIALKSSERLVRIVNDMLDLSKLEAGRLQLRLERLEPQTIIAHAVDGVAALAREAGIAIRTDLPDHLPPVRGDADRLTQALVNLLSNAIKFAPHGSPVTIAARETAAAVSVSVSDEGHGIAEADVKRLFQKFQQLDAAGPRRTGGTGLGLAITKGIVEAHGGTITVASVVGQGTTFTFTVPRS